MSQRVPIDDTIKFRSSTYEKEKKDFERQIQIIDYLDNYNGNLRDDECIKNYQINYDLMNGRVDTTMYNADDYCLIENEKVTIKEGEIPHVPLISSVTKILHGEQIGRYFKLSVEDNSPFSESVEEEEYKRLTKQFVQESIIAPIEQQVLQEVLIQNGITDPYSLNAEQQNSIRQTVSQQTAALTPEKIREYMENDFKSPITQQAQEITDYLTNEFRLKEKQDDGFLHMMPTALECYYANATERGLEFDLVNPKFLQFGGPSEEEWIQNMDWVKREEWSTVVAITQKYADVLREEHWEEIEKNIEPLFGTKHYQSYRAGLDERKYQIEISANGKEIVDKFGDQNSNLKENFNNILRAQEYVQSKWGSTANMHDFGIRVTHYAWKDKRKLYKVWRATEDGIKVFYFSESYKKVAKDLKVKEIWVNEVWEGTKIGTSDPIYINIMPVKYQWKSLDNPYDVELPYVGKKYNIMRGNTKNVTIIDLAKQFQRDYDTQMAWLRRDLKTNLGKVFAMLIDSKPDNMTWTDVLNVARDYNLLLINPNKKGGMVDPQFMKGVDMSKMSDIAQRLVLINDIMQKLYRSMGFNEFRAAGSTNQYANTVNINSQQQASYNQTEAMFETHRIIFEKACNRLLNISRLYYKDNPDKLKSVLSRVSYEELKYGYPFWYSEHFKVRLENSGKVARQIEFLRQQTQAFIQNAMSPKEVIELAMAENKTDLVNLMRKIDKKIKDAQESASQEANARLQVELEAKLTDQREDRELKYKMHRESLDSLEARAEIQSKVFLNANDSNMDGEPDLITKTKLDNEVELKIHEDKMRLEREKLK